MSLRGTASAPTNEPVDESYKKIIPNSTVEIPDIRKPYTDPKTGQQVVPTEGARLFFRWYDTAETSIRHGVKFWVNTGAVRMKDKSIIAIPLVSANPFDDFMVNGRKGLYVGRSAAEKGCVLSKLADMRHPVIAVNTYREDKANPGSYMPKVDPFHAIHVQLVNTVKDANGKLVLINNRPQVKVEPEALGFEFRQAWWDMFVNVLEPLPPSAAPVEDDGMVDNTPKAPPAITLAEFMEKNGIKKLGQIIFFIQKIRRTGKGVTGNPDTDVDYKIGFSDKLWILESEEVAPVDPLDWEKVYKTPVQKDLDEMVHKAETRAGMAPSGGGAPAANQQGAHVPSPDDKTAYVGHESVPMDGGAPQGVAGGAKPAAALGNQEGADPF